MKKSEFIALISGIACIAVIAGFFAISSKISKAEGEAQQARRELAHSEQREALARQALVHSEQREEQARKQLAELGERQRQLELQERERLMDDWGWVQKQDTLSIYRRFATKFPNHPEIDAINKRIIDLEVKEIADGKHGEMPLAQPLAIGGNTVEVEIENKTGYILTVLYSGVESKRVVIPVSASASVTLVPGDYQIAASVSAGNVTNFFGRDTMRGGRYSSSFFIQTIPR